MTPYKIIFTDLDGTLLSTKNDVSEFTITQISRIRSSIPFILVSARMPKSMRYLQKRLGIEKEPIICYNGAQIVLNGKTLFSKIISTALLRNIYEVALEKGLKIGLYFDDEWYVEHYSQRIEKEIFNTKVHPQAKQIKEVINDWEKEQKGAHKVMCMGLKDQVDIMQKYLEKAFSKELNIYRSNDTLIELAPLSVSKITAIESVLHTHYPFDLSEVIAFGDNFNDIEMLKAVGMGVAVQNARKEVKTIANAITDENKQDGVAKYIQKVFQQSLIS